MGNCRAPGPVCGHGKPVDLNDGTTPRTAFSAPGPVCLEQSSSVRDYARRLGYVEQAWTRCSTHYAEQAIIKQVGDDAGSLLNGIVVGLLMAMGVLILTTGVGAVIGGAIGALGGGVGAIPGAVVGADLGLTIGNGILAWAGLGFLVVYIGSHLGEMGSRFDSAIRTAWNSCGHVATIEAAAREFAEGIGFLVSLILQAIVVFLAKGASGQGAAKSLAQLRESMLFKHCPRLEPWLIKNYPRLRAKYIPLSWTVLEEGPRIPNTSIPEWMRIRVGEREFHVWRDPDKLGFKSGEPKGPAMKHLGERAQVVEESATIKEAMKALKDQGIEIAPSKKWEKSPWAKASQTDMPISTLAAALEQAEAQLMFQPPQRDAKPTGIQYWEFVIDTTGPVWRVEHAEYKANPKW